MTKTDFALKMTRATKKRESVWYQLLAQMGVAWKTQGHGQQSDYTGSSIRYLEKRIRQHGVYE